jgi:hypothetical protein
VRTIYCRLAQLAARVAHIHEVKGSSPLPAPILAAGQPDGIISGAPSCEGALPSRNDAAITLAADGKRSVGFKPGSSPAFPSVTIQARQRPCFLGLGQLLAISHGHWGLQ